MKILAFLFIMLLACNNENNGKFNKEKWCETEDLQLHLNRADMLHELC